MRRASVPSDRRVRAPRALLAAVCVLLAAAGVRAHAQEPVPAPPEVVPEPAPPVQVVPPEPAIEPVPVPALAPAPAAYAAAWTEAAFESEIARLVAAHPARLRVSTLGTSKQGRRIALLTLGDLAGDPDQRPAALLATDLEARFGERPGGP
ncbi:MAG: hypothetical protein NTY35_10915 [Planctomycetota bacterium]|nr:hypothetical protein [Planctomycetota bacterium]